LLKDFQLTLMRNLLTQAGQEWNVQGPVGGTAPAAATQFDLRKTWQATFSYSICHAKMSYVFGQGCHLKSYSHMWNVWCLPV